VKAKGVNHGIIGCFALRQVTLLQQKYALHDFLFPFAMVVVYSF
jgi:hypothetical protein